MDSLRKLKFDTLQPEMTRHCPILWQALLDAVTNTYKEESTVTCRKKDVKPTS